MNEEKKVQELFESMRGFIRREIAAWVAPRDAKIAELEARINSLEARVARIGTPAGAVAALRRRETRIT